VAAFLVVRRTGLLSGLVGFTCIALSAYHLRNQYRHATVLVHTVCSRQFITPLCVRFDFKQLMYTCTSKRPRYRLCAQISTDEHRRRQNMQSRKSGEADSRSAIQQFYSLLANQKIHYRVHRDICTVLPCVKRNPFFFASPPNKLRKYGGNCVTDEETSEKM
jgi:hypothetical protein